MTAYRAFAAASPPTTGNADGAVSLGVEFYVTSTASLTAIHWWNPTTTTDGSTRSAGLFDMSSALLVGPVTQAPGGPGWQTINVTPYSLAVSAHYRVAVLHPAGCYSATANYFTSLPDIVNGPLTVVGEPNATDNEQGTFNYNSSLSFPDVAFNSGNYWVDLTVTTPGEPGINIQFTKVL